MRVEQEQTDRFFRTFVNTLGRYRIGQSLLREVSVNSSKDKRSQVSFRSVSFGKAKKAVSSLPKDRKERVKTNMSSDSQIRDFKQMEDKFQTTMKMRQTHFSPKNIYNNEKIEEIQKAKLIKRQLVRDRNNSTYYSIMNMRKEAIIQQFLRIRMQWLKLNRIDHILSTLVPNQNVNTLRIYKERMKKFYNHRYKKEKITIFFDYEYIEDYDSQLKYLQILLSLKMEEINYMCFLMLDHNGDGLICNNDLFNTATVGENPLINKDIYKINQYISDQQLVKPDVNILDPVSDQEFFKPENTNLQKHRLLEHRQEKEREKMEKEKVEESLKNGLNLIGHLQAQTVKNKDKKGIYITRKTHRHLFSHLKDEQQGEQAIKKLRKKIASNQLSKKSKYEFKINFQRFKTIFANMVPQTYFDVLYVVGGIELPQKNYLPLNFEIDQPEKQFDEATGIQVDRYNVVQNRIDKMRQTNLKSRVQRFAHSSMPIGWRFSDMARRVQ